MQKSNKLTTTRKRVGITNNVNLTYTELLKLYERDCKLRNISEETVIGYKNAARYFLKFCGKDVTCNEITQELLDEYKFYLMDKYKPETVNSYVFKVSPVLKFAFERGYLPYKIEIIHMVEQERYRNIYTPDELTTLLKRPTSNLFAEYRNWVIINFLLGTGARAKETREVLIKDVDFEQEVIHLNHTKNRKNRSVPMSSTLYKVMYEYVARRNGADDEPLFCNQFGEKLCRTTLQMSITKYCKKRGVNKYSLHLFRHTFITLSVQNGMSPLMLKKITGHANFKVLDTYYNSNVSDIVNIIDEYNPLEMFKKREKIDFNNKVKKKGKSS